MVEVLFAGFLSSWTMVEVLFARRFNLTYRHISEINPSPLLSFYSLLIDLFDCIFDISLNILDKNIAP